jgi:hypothetical protein
VCLFADCIQRIREARRYPNACTHGSCDKYANSYKYRDSDANRNRDSDGYGYRDSDGYGYRDSNGHSNGYSHRFRNTKPAND